MHLYINEELFEMLLNEDTQSEAYYINQKKTPSKIEFTETGNTYWKPLYDWLKTFFGDMYKKAAGQWMHMAYVKPWLEFDGWMYEYKHGMTRKSILLDENGTPYTIKWLKKDGKHVLIDGSLIKEGLIRDTYKNSFNRVYKDIEQFVKRKEGENPCFVSYNDEYRRKIFAALEAAGYNVCGVHPKRLDDLKNIIGNE